MNRRRPHHRGRFRAASVRVATAAAAALLAAGCSGSGHGGTGRSASTVPVSPPSSAPGATTPTPDARVQILDQYRAFWAHLTPASRAAASQRRQMLSPYAADPELKSLLSGMAQGDQAGTVFYGQDRPRPAIGQVSVPQGIAVIRDCQDSSHSGNADRRTGRRVTVGVARHLVIATMHLADGVWRVAFVTYKQAKC